MVEMTEADADAGTATLEMNRDEVFMFRNAAFAAADARKEAGDEADAAAFENVREMFPVPSDRTKTVHMEFSAGELVDITNALFRSAEAAEADDRAATARRLNRQVQEVAEGIAEAGRYDEAEVRSQTAMENILRSKGEVSA